MNELHDQREQEAAEERRVRRSDDPISALHYQLAHCRHEAQLDAMVLADETGQLVAGSGAWPVCEELAAFAPLLARQGDAVSETIEEEVRSMRGGVTLRSMLFDGSEVILAARGPMGSITNAMLVRAAAGCRRILRVAA